MQHIRDEVEKSIINDPETLGPSFSSPWKNLIHNKPVTELDDFKKDVIRRSVQEFYDRCEYPTLKKLQEALKTKIEYTGGITSLYKILRKLSFRYLKCNVKKFLMERKDIVARVSFLRKMHNIRKKFIHISLFILTRSG